jgi:peptidoglycan/xylan/chitin deacetylase (PgdA/CDA1 family)
MKFSKQIARRILFPAIVNSGLEKRWRNKSEKSILNIIYHGVVSENSSYFSPRHIDKEQFEKHLKYFSKEFDIISLNEAFEYNINNRIPKRKTITISFDDGYKNNLDIALPLLEKYNVKTTFFISSILTQEMEIRTIWADIIACLKYFYQDEIIEIENCRFINFIDQSTKISLQDFFKTRDVKTRDSLLDQFIKKYDLVAKFKQLPDEIWQLMNTEQLKTLSQSKIVDIGSHGHLHYNLGDIDLKDAVNDIATSKELLEQTLSSEIDMIAYPDNSYTLEVKNKASELGLNKQLAVSYNFQEDFNDIRILPRQGVSCTTTYESNIFFINKAFQTTAF